ncbi:unnamed protein product [Cercospora beticola]|nr:unnamed protein product [Cercospora beticola]
MQFFYQSLVLLAALLAGHCQADCARGDPWTCDSEKQFTTCGEKPYTGTCGEGHRCYIPMLGVGGPACKPNGQP